MTDCMPLFVCVGMIVWAFFLPTILFQLVCYAHVPLELSEYFLVTDTMYIHLKEVYIHIDNRDCNSTGTG